MNKIKITENENEQRIDRFLRKLLKNYPLKEIYKYIRKGTVKVNGKKVKENYKLQINDIVNIYVKELELIKEYEKSSGKLDIIYEDANILILDKPVGLLSHSNRAKDNDTLIQRVLGYLEPENKEYSLTFNPALCNRLDRNTSGLIIAAKNYNALKDVNETIRLNGISKLYLCIVKGKTESRGEISNVLMKDEDRKIAYTDYNDLNQGKKAITKYKRLAYNGDYSLIEVELITGRFHQIRAHLALEKHPIIGDSKYGDKEINRFFYKKFGLKYQFLIAYRLHFKNPVKSLEYLKDKTWYSSIPASYAEIMEGLFGSVNIF